MSGYRFLADLVVVVHLAYVAFVVLGMLAILVGVWLRWQWVSNFWFRVAHFTMIAVVAIQSLMGTLCPLTTLEKNLRLRAGDADYPGSFIGHWAHELLFIDAPEWAFTLSYCLFGLLVAATLLLAPPRWVTSRNRPS